MEFQWKGRKVVLRGDDSLANKDISFCILQRLIKNHHVDEIFELQFLSLSAPEIQQHEIENFSTLSPSTQAVLTEYQEVFKPPTELPSRRRFEHRIHLAAGSTPVNVRPYRYPYFQKDTIEKMVREMLEQGIIRPSQSPFFSPVLLVKKRDGSFHFCVDYRALNTVTIKDKFPIPTVDELLDELGGARIFSKLDLRSGYHQIRVHEKDIFKTAFRTHEGHYEFLVMPFGLSNAPSTFQATMNFVLQPFLRRFVVVFFDDILIYSSNEDEHVMHLQSVLRCLHSHRFFVKLSKCTFCQSSVEYLGHIVGDGVVRADPKKIEAMTAWPPPRSVKQLRGFIGLTGYYRKFFKDYATIVAPLTDLLRKDKFNWDSTASVAFEALKNAMVSAPVLQLPNFKKLFIVETDASDVGIGAVLLQKNLPLAYHNRKLGSRLVGASAYLKEFMQ